MRPEILAIPDVLQDNSLSHHKKTATKRRCVRQCPGAGGEKRTSHGRTASSSPSSVQWSPPSSQSHQRDAERSLQFAPNIPFEIIGTDRQRGFGPQNCHSPSCTL